MLKAFFGIGYFLPFKRVPRLYLYNKKLFVDFFHVLRSIVFVYIYISLVQ